MLRHRRTRQTALFLAVVGSCACGSSKEWTPPPAYVPPEPPPTVEEPAPAPSAAPLPPAPPAPKAAPTGAPKAAAPAPMPGDLPNDVEATLSAHLVCKKADCQLAALVPEAPGVDLRGPAVVWSHELAAAGNAVALPRHSDVDVYGVVMRGSVELAGAEGGKPLSAGRWSAFRAPGAGVTVTAREAPARVVLAAVSSGGPLSDAIGALRAGKGTWKTRPAQLDSIDMTGVRDLSWGGGAMHARIAFEGDKQRASLGVLMASKDAPVAQHQHDTSWEVLVALRAAGTARRASAPGPSAQLEPVSVKDGAVVTIPKATQHSWTPNGQTPLIAVQLYVPPGPEQRFKKLAAAEPSPGFSGRR